MRREEFGGRDGDELLAQAHAALDRGEAAVARDLAQRALGASLEAQDRLMQARALLVLGHADRLVSRFRRAHDACQKAAHLFRLLGDGAGEAAALATLAHVATCLGRNEEAVEAALLGERLGEACESLPLKAMLLNYLGVAYLWSRNFDKADAAFAAAVSMAERANSGASPFQPLLNRVWAEALRAVTERHRTGRMPPLDRMRAFEQACAALAAQGRARGLFEGSRITGAALALLGSALLRCWSGDGEGAARLLAEAGQWVRCYGTTTWLEVFERWVSMELAWARGDLEQAVAHCALLIEVARRLEYEQLVCLGHLFESQLHEQQGAHARALDALRQLRQREQLIRVESLQSRERAVQWQLDFRRSESDVQRLEGLSRHLERLSLEDSLTGIANRRCFEARLGELLADRAPGGSPLCIAFVDVDRFKQVNDGHSHRVGDQVLRDIARMLATHVREGDVAARLAGDEFAVILNHATRAEAEQVCERVARAVETYPWQQCSPGLQVSISFGVAQAQPGDTVQTLLHGGDLAMYASKRSARAELPLRVTSAADAPDQ